MRASRKEKKERRWSDSDKMMALGVFYQSPKAYRFLFKFFMLPLLRSTQGIKPTTGFNDVLFELQSKYSAGMAELERLCVITFDEVALKTGL